jgi:hypothetical protein
MYQRDTLLEDLRQHILSVTFTKENGEERVMRCTLWPKYLPAKYLEEREGEAKFHRENKDVIRCWDIAANGWRSFRIDSVTYCEDVSQKY